MQSRLIHLAIAVVALAGCAQEEGLIANTPPKSKGNFQLIEEPDGAIGVAELREQARQGDSVVVVGCIGGGVSPWIKGRAAFVLVDVVASMECDDACTDENCNCRAVELADSIVMVKFLDEQGQVIATDAKQLLGVEALETVVVKGKATRDKAGNVALIAEGLYIRR
jgi:hypothetical protein